MPQKRKPKKPSASKPLYPIPELITQLLVTINMFEGTDTKNMDIIADDLRDGHTMLKDLIGARSDFQTNGKLATLDAAYKAAGWDENGLRWERGDDGVMDIFIVEFTNPEHTKWRLT